MKLFERWKSWIDTSDAIVAHWLRAAREALLGEMPILCAGTALFAIISTLPLLAAAISIYALVADPHLVEQHLRPLASVLPPGMIDFLQDQLAQQTKRSTSSVGITLVVSVLLAVFSARGAAHAMIDSLNRAYRVRERRKGWQKFLMTLAMGAGAMIGMMTVFAVTVGLHSAMVLLKLNGYGLVPLVRWPLLMAVVFAGLLVLYRFAPSPRTITERHLWPGALIGTFGIVAVSLGLSQYVERIAKYDVVYGAFGSVIVVLLWFYLSVMALVVGGFVNAELERHAGAPQPERSPH